MCVAMGERRDFQIKWATKKPARRQETEPRKASIADFGGRDIIFSNISRPASPHPRKWHIWLGYNNPNYIIRHIFFHV